MNWGTKIVIAFILFGVFMGGMIMVCLQHDVNLVAGDYYKQEIEYDNQIEKIRNAESLLVQPRFAYEQESRSFLIEFPEQTGENVAGVVHFFRPSDYKMDKKFEIQLNEYGTQRMSLQNLKKGLWKAKVEWTSGEKSYYKEEVIIL